MGPEELRDIEGFSRYAVSNYGKIYNKIFDLREMRPSIGTHEGYLKISLIDDNELRRTCSVARLVAEAFVPRPNPRSDHVVLLDGDLTNVAASNLAWRTRHQAWNYRRQIQQPETEWPDAILNVPVRNVDTGVVYDNIYQCARIEGLLIMEVFASCAAALSRPPIEKPVYPNGYLYAFVVSE